VRGLEGRGEHHPAAEGLEAAGSSL
jgi:hypothetical protein